MTPGSVRRPWLTNPFVSIRNALTAGMWCGVISDVTTYYPRTTSIGDYVAPAGLRRLGLCLAVGITIALAIAVIRSAVRRERLGWD
jgi:hypothetical protein